MKKTSVFLTCFTLWACVVVSQAETVTWTGNSGTDLLWKTSGNWNTGTAPVKNDTVWISSGSPVAFGNAASTFDMYGNTTVSGTGSISDITTSTTYNVYYRFHQNLTLDGTSMTVDAMRLLAGIETGETTWNLNNANFTFKQTQGSKNGTFRFGNTWVSGLSYAATDTITANLNVTNSAFSAERLMFGNNASQASIVVSAVFDGSSTLALGNDVGSEKAFYMGRTNSSGSSAATLTLNDQANFSCPTTGVCSAYIGSSLSEGKGTGIITLNSTGTVVLPEVYLGNGTNASGTLNVLSGTPSVGTSTTDKKNLHIGNTDSSGEVNVQGGTLTIYGKMHVGKDATGTVLVSGGTLMANDELDIGYLSGSRGTFTQTGGTTQAKFFCIGWQGGAHGTVNLEGGTLNVSNNLRVGHQDNYTTETHFGTGNLTVGGGVTSATTSNLYLQSGSTLTFQMDANNLAGITVNTAAYLNGGTLTADFSDGLQFANTSYTLLTKVSKESGFAGSTLQDSAFFDVAQNATTVTAAVRTDVLPDDASVLGVRELTDTDTLTFYIESAENIGKRDSFAAWLNSLNPSLNAQALGGGGIQVAVPEGMYDYILWDFSEYNALHGTNMTFSSTSYIPEPATWMLLLLGLGVHLHKRRRAARHNEQ